MSYPYQITSLAQYKETYSNAEKDPEKFWAEVASHFKWQKKWDKVLDWNFKEPCHQMVYRRENEHHRKLFR